MDKPQRTSLPLDYNSIRTAGYDPAFISDISNKMQVPDTISFGNYGQAPFSDNGFSTRPINMMVPDRIIVAGDNKHIGLKEGLRPLEFERLPETDSSYVGLITPPRTLTLEERFPTVEDAEKQKVIPQEGIPKPDINGMVPVPYTPGISPYESLLLNEEDEATLLRTHVSKLTRRLAVMEQDNQRRSNRELFLYPAVFGYLFIRVFFWFLKTR